MPKARSIEQMNRRIFMRNLGATSALFALPNLVSAQQNTNKRPNIILFITDDQDKESIGCYGGNAYSPNLDRLAREGMLCHNAYNSSTICTPSRYSLLTGRYPGRCYGEQYLNDCAPGDQGFPEFNVDLEDDNLNVGAILQQNGYVTGYVGKFHVGPHIKNQLQFEKFGLQYVHPDSEPDAKASEAFRENERRYREYLKKKGFSWAKNIYWGNLQKPFNRHNPEWTIAAALEFIEANKDRPFYLHYCTTLLHGPKMEWYRSLDSPLISGEGLLDSLPQVMTDRQELLKELDKRGLDAKKGHAGYTWIDDSMGAVLKTLDKLGISDNTLFIFIGDNGSRMKGSLYHRDGLNVPCIMRWPKGIHAGIETDELIQSIDFVPTFFDIAGANVPDKYIMDGKSMLPLLKNNGRGALHEHLYFELGHARAVCTKDWKYIAVRYPKEQIQRIKKARTPQLAKLMAYFGRLGIGIRGAVNPNFFQANQLYHLKTDREEMNNLAKNPNDREQLAQMRRILKTYLQSFGRPFGEFTPGGNAAPDGLIEEQIESVKSIKFRNKTVILPDGSEYDDN